MIGQMSKKRDGFAYSADKGTILDGSQTLIEGRHTSTYKFHNEKDHQILRKSPNPELSAYKPLWFFDCLKSFFSGTNLVPENICHKGCFFFRNFNCFLS